MIRALRQLLFACFLLVLLPSYLGSQPPCMREDFNDLADWKPLYFPKIKNHTSYSIESAGAERYVKASSRASASALVYKEEFNVYAFPVVRWRWKAENVYKKGDATTKAGDDYPIRIYIMFKYDPDKAGFLARVTYGAAKLIYGEYPPQSSLNYIWANKRHGKAVITSPYTEKAKMIPLQEGETNVGKWVTQQVDILQDYEKAFGTKPPTTARLAIMNDSDNTGEASVSYVDYIEICR